MAKIRPFKGVRPPVQWIEQVASRPYDVLSSKEARQEASGNPMSLYHIIKPEVDCPEGTDPHQPMIIDKAKTNFQAFQDKGWLVQDDKPHYYIYAQTMNGKTQYGLVVAVSVQDYLDGNIKKHELTRRVHEEDRMKHVRACQANIEPVFFAYHDDDMLINLLDKYAQTEPVYHFVAPDDGFGHTFWTINEEDDLQLITERFSKMDSLYIADGHHRSAAAALVGAEMAKNNPNHTGEEEYYYFMAVCFPESQLTIIDYNRLINHLNGHSDEEFLELLKAHFEVYPKGKETYHPESLHTFGLYLDGQWYKLVAKPHTYSDDHPIDSLDVTVSSKYILHDILGIEDLRTDKNIDFVGGIRGLDTLSRRVDSGEMRVALALYPVSMKQLMDIADQGEIMPPKTTWFEPKLRSGLVIHKLERE